MSFSLSRVKLFKINSSSILFESCNDHCITNKVLDVLIIEIKSVKIRRIESI